MSDTVSCEKCHKEAEFLATVHNNSKGIHYDLYVCEDGHETKVKVEPVRQ